MMENKRLEKQSSKQLGLIVKRFANVYQIYLLGVSVVIGGQMVIWHIGLASGFFEFLLATVLISMGYGCLTLCVAELTSVLPFSGGTYGLCRVTLGSYAGYMIGCFESLQSTFYVAAVVSIFGSMLTQLFGTSMNYEPVWWLLFYITALTLQIKGNSSIAVIVSSFAVLIVLLIVIFDAGTASTMNFERHAIEGEQHNKSDSGQITDFLHYLPYACWFYMGIENLPLICGDTKSAINRVPRAMLWLYGTAAISTFVLLFACASHYPGVLNLSSLHITSPLISGFSNSFSLSKQLCVLLVLPGTYSSAFGFLFSCGKQMSAMAKSVLLPAVFSVAYHYDPNDVEAQVPITALVGCSLIGYCTLLILWFNFNDRLMMRYLLVNVCLLASFAVYIGIFSSFLVFRRKYYTLDKGRPFYNPIGKLKSAGMGLCVFALAAVGVCGFQGDSHVALIVFSAYILVMTGYYYAVSQKRQHFSAEEQAALLVAYIINTNSKGKKKITRSHSFKKEQSFRNQLIRTGTSLRSIHRSSDTLGTPQRSAPSSPAKGLHHGNKMQLIPADGPTVSMHSVGRNDSMATMRTEMISGLNSIKETASPEGKRFIARDTTIPSENSMLSGIEEMPLGKSVYNDAAIHKTTSPHCLTSESTATTSNIMFNISPKSAEAVKKDNVHNSDAIVFLDSANRDDGGDDESQTSSPGINKKTLLFEGGSSSKNQTEQTETSISSVIPFSSSSREHLSDDTLSLFHASSSSHSVADRTKIGGIGFKNSLLIVHSSDEEEKDDVAKLTANSHSSVGYQHPSRQIQVNKPHPIVSADSVVSIQSKGDKSIIGGSDMSAHKEEESHMHKGIHKQNSKLLTKQNSKIMVKQNSKILTKQNSKVLTKQNSFVNSSEKFIRSLFYGSSNRDLSADSGKSNHGVSTRASFLPRALGRLYAATEGENDDEEGITPTHKDRKKAHRRPSLGNDIYNSLVSPSGKSGRFRSNVPHYNNGGGNGLKSSFSVKNSFSILNSNDIAKILPVMNIEDDDIDFNHPVSEYDRHTNDVVSRVIADNMGIEYFDSLLGGSLEEGVDEGRQEEGDEDDQQPQDHSEPLTNNNNNGGELSQIGYNNDDDKEEGRVNDNASHALDRHISSRIQQIAQGYFIRQQSHGDMLLRK